MAMREVLIAHLKKQIHPMKIKTKIGMVLLRWAAASMGTFILASCAAPKVHQTIALSHRYPGTSATQVEILERGSPTNRNHQIIGKVTVEGTNGVSNSSAKDMAKQTAAEMGADAVIDYHRGPGCERRFNGGMHYSGIAVKWLAPGQARQPLASPFVIYRLPIKDPVSGNYMFTKNAMGENHPHADRTWVNRAVFKGYHVLPTTDVTYRQPINQLRGQSPGQLKNIGTPDSQLLLGVDFVSKNNVDLGVVSWADAEVQVTVLDKQTGRVVLQKQAKGEHMPLPGLAFNMIQDQLQLAVSEAIKNAIEDLPNISK